MSSFNNYLLFFFAVTIFVVTDCHLVLNLSNDSSEEEIPGTNIDEVSDDQRFLSGLASFFTGRKSICDEQCGIPYKDNTNRVIGGSETTPNQFPWMVHLVIVYADYLRRRQSSCGATLIKNQYLLTAAHCVFHRKILSITAYLGHHYLDNQQFEATGNELIIPVSQVYIHEEFDPLVMRNDIAILELPRAIRFTNQVHSICLTQDKVNSSTNNMDAVVAGWGRTEVYGTKFFPQLLLSATLPLVDLKQCRRNLQQLGSIVTNENICAGGLSSDSCVGDSGGPLMVANSSSNSNTTIRYSQLGITSWGVGCAEKGIPAVYTRVESHLPWIQRITRKDSCVPAAPNIS